MPRLLVLLSLLIALLAAAPAGAAPDTQIGVADDGILVEGSNQQVDTAIAQWKAAGVDTVRVFARWSGVAPGVQSKKMPAGFDPTNPNDPQYGWGGVDRAVGAIDRAGMKVLLTITGSGPCWGNSPARCGRRIRENPNPVRFGQFAEAAAKRYAATVDTYIIWNEPNQVTWLQPQARCKGRSCTPHSPHVYRKLVRAAEPKIRAADPQATILIGALAPDGTDLNARNDKVRPLAFIRAFGCVDKRYKRIRGGECRNFKPAIADGFAYHPHGIRLAPNKHMRNKDSAQIGDLSRLTRVLDKVTRKGGIKVRGARRFPLYLTEYAYQTNPPDRFSGVSLSAQSSYMQQGAFIAWRNSRVKNITQYVWVDEASRAGGQGWQSGLYFSDGRPKPSLASFPVPFWAQKVGKGNVQLWGQVRPGNNPQTVELQRRSGSSWISIGTVTTNAFGYYTRTVSQSSATTYRAVTPAGTTSTRFVTG